MKLKEKLAEEYSWNIHTGGSDGKLEQAYIAGFEKAKRMMWEEYNEASKRYGSAGYPQHTRSHVLAALNLVGDEEV